MTLRGLSATVPPIVPVYVANDGSSNHDVLRYLTTTEDVQLKGMEFPNDHPQWRRNLGYVPNHNVVRGIAGKVNVVLRGIPAGTKNIGFAARLAFDQTGASHVIKIEDDILFKKGWYQTICHSLLKHPDVGLISGFRYFWSSAATTVRDSIIEILVRGYTGGVMMAVSRVVLDRCPDMFINEITAIADNEDFWIDRTRQGGLRVAVTAASVCQHIGVVTEAKCRPYMNKDGRIVKIDHSLFPPYEMAEEVGCFREGRVFRADRTGDAK